MSVCSDELTRAPIVRAKASKSSSLLRLSSDFKRIRDFLLLYLKQSKHTHTQTNSHFLKPKVIKMYEVLSIFPVSNLTKKRPLVVLLSLIGKKLLKESIITLEIMKFPYRLYSLRRSTELVAFSIASTKLRSRKTFEKSSNCSDLKKYNFLNY